MTAPGRYLSFDAVADDYDQTRVIPDVQVDEIVRLCAAEAHLGAGGLLLDAGVGTGRFAAPLADRHPGQVVGLDVSPAMMARARAKAAPGSLTLIGGDLQRLPFKSGTFRAVLAVHILHLIEHWALVLEEIRRVLVPRTGLLLLGSEQGGRSLVVDFYYERARARGLLAPSLGAPARSRMLDYLVRRTGARVALVPTPDIAWTREVPVSTTLDALSRRTYSQMWNIPDDAHRALLAETVRYARQTFREFEAPETLRARFVLHAVRWPS